MYGNGSSTYDLESARSLGVCSLGTSLSVVSEGRVEASARLLLLD